MKRIPFILNVFLLLASCLILASCKKTPEEKVTQVTFAGSVSDASNGAMESTVIINGMKFKTNAEGRFEASVDSAGSYSIKANKKGYIGTAKVYAVADENVKLTLYSATVKSFDPTQDITLTDTKSTERPGPSLQHANFTGSLSQIPMVYENGKLVDFGFSTEMQKAFDYVRSQRNPGTGISVSIPANTLVRNGSKPAGNVQVAVSTIDLFSAGNMPGDMTVVDENGRRSGFMISYGAGSIEVFDEEGNYQLDKGAEAEISIPVDSSAYLYGNEIPNSIPLFYYNEDSGFWTVAGKAVLNQERNAYVGKLQHFSTFNMDIEKTTPACLQVRNTGAAALPAYKVEAIVPDGSGGVIHMERTITDPESPSTSSWPIGDPGPCLQNSNNTSVHMLYNLPENTEVCLIFYEPGSPDVAVNIAVATTGTSYGSSLPICLDAMCDPSCPDNCTTTSCGGYGSCEFVPFGKITSPVILAAKATGSDIDFKWVYNNSAATYTYNLVEIDEFGNPIGVPLCTVSNTAADNPLEPKSCTVTGVGTGQHFYKVQVVETSDESQQYDLTI